LIDIASGKIEQVFEEPNGWIRAVAWGPGPGQLTTASQNHHVRVWHIASGRIVRTHNHGQSDKSRLWLSTQAEKLGLKSEDGSGDLLVWDVGRLPIVAERINRSERANQ
jgi:WD40 repeat protein